jgi:hypothetical protein
MSTDRFVQRDVQFVPANREPGVLYVSRRHDTAVHTCPCGCGNKVVTPLSPSRWMLSSGPAGPTLRPSVGNWQFPCRSHYWIVDGRVRWSGAWTYEEVQRGAANDRAAVEFEYRRSHLTIHRWFRRMWQRIRRR